MKIHDVCLMATSPSAGLRVGFFFAPFILEDLVCFSDLTKEERNALLTGKNTQFLKNLCCYLADRIQELGDIIEEQLQQLLLNDLVIGRTSGEENGWISSENVRQHFAEKKL